MAQHGRKSLAKRAAMAWDRERPSDDRALPAADHLRPPEHLTDETKRWWAAIVANYAFEEYELRTLQAACEAWDLYQKARCELAEHGLTYRDDKGMIRPMPQASISRDARTSFLRAVRELRLGDDAEPKEPRIGGIGVLHGYRS